MGFESKEARVPPSSTPHMLVTGMWAHFLNSGRKPQDFHLKKMQWQYLLSQLDVRNTYDCVYTCLVLAYG